ncbi:MAG: histidine kinase N-terminal 7TM domain-containing protein [Candidatus Heimdallarchaeota archaeon]
MNPDFLGSYFWNWWSLPYWLSFVASLIVTILLVVKKREGTVQLFIVAAILITFNTLVSSLAACTLDPDLWLKFIASTVITGPLAISIIFHYSFSLLIKEPTIKGMILEHKRILIVYLVPLVLISMVLIVPELLWPEVVLVPERSNYGIYGTTPARISYIWSIYNFYQGLMLFLVTINFFRIYRHTVGLERKQAAYFILAALVPAIALTIVGFIQYLGFPNKLELSTVAVAIAMSIIAIGVLRAQLFDIELIVSKSVKYTLLNILLAYVFVISREILTPLISDIFFSGSQVAMLLAGFMVVTLFTPIKNATSSITAKLLPADRPQRLTTDNLELYRRQLEIAWTDKTITEKEQMMLDALKSSFGISPEDHNRLKREVLRNSNQIK